MSYCIAFSSEGATDVTRRYVRNASIHGLDRKRAPEEVLLYIINEIRKMRRQGLSKEERRRLWIEDEREDRELRSYVVQALAASIGVALPNLRLENAPTTTPGRNVEQKVPGRQSGNAEWREARGENGPQAQGPNQERH